MKEEILRMLYDRSVNKKIFDSDDLMIIYQIFVNNYYGITKYLKDIVIENNGDVDAFYSGSRRQIVINMDMVIEGLKEEIEKLSLKDNQIYFYYNIQLLLIMFHELQHVRQIYKAQNSGILGTLMFYGKTLGTPLSEGNETEEYKRMVTNLYNRTYEYNPCEREAYIESARTVKSIIGRVAFIDVNILDYLNHLELKSLLKGYIKVCDIVSCPSEIYFSIIGNELIWKNLPFYSDKSKKIVKNTKKIFTLQERLTYGLPIDYEEYVKRIKLLPRVLEHLEDTNKEFDNYMMELSKYDEEYIINYWIYLLYIELISNQKIENIRNDEYMMTDKQIFFDTLNISHKRIHTVHNFITEGELAPSYSYRNDEARVSKINPDGSETIFWRGVSATDVNKFMNDFIKVYKQGGTSLIYSNPFLASSLIHLLFLRIHPYADGNGRTARILHNIKFTEMINKLYGTRLKLSPLNISESILINKITYVKRIDNLYFDVKNDCNEEINAWFNFILDMVDEQLYKSMNMLDYIDTTNINSEHKNNMRLSRLKHR